MAATFKVNSKFRDAVVRLALFSPLLASMNSFANTIICRIFDDNSYGALVVDVMNAH